MPPPTTHTHIHTRCPSSFGWRAGPTQAIQLDPECVVAQTLAGHELVANGELEQAIVCYRTALGHDPRHYNAWYGLGDVEHRREKAEAAEVHFRRALDIHPNSPVLRCHLGMVSRRRCVRCAVLCGAVLRPTLRSTCRGLCSVVPPPHRTFSYCRSQVLHMTGKHAAALDMLAVASKLQPGNPQARFQRANVFLALGRLEVRARPWSHLHIHLHLHMHPHLHHT